MAGEANGGQDVKQDTQVHASPLAAEATAEQNRGLAASCSTVNIV